MRKISIDELNNMVDSSYSLVTIISKRARQIIDGSDALIKTSTIKPVGVAIEEFYDNKYEAIYDYDKYKKSLADDIENEKDIEEDNMLESDNIEEIQTQEE